MVIPSEVEESRRECFR